MRRPRIASCVYWAILLCTCGSIGPSVPAGVLISVEAEAEAPLAPARIIPVVAAADKPVYREIGIASWYGPQQQGRMTASGEIFDQNRLTAAHRSLPLETKAKVTNLANGRSVEVKVNDRGPYIRSRVIDLSARAAKELGMTRRGIALVRIEVLGEEAARSAVD